MRALRPSALLFLLVLHVLASDPSTPRRPAKRHYATHNYYLLEHDPSHGVSPEECAGMLGAELVEQVGELADHWLLRAERGSTADVDDRVLESYSQLHSEPSIYQTLRKRHLSSAVKRLSLQVPRQRTKRGPLPVLDKRPPPPPTDDALARSIAQRLGILDPLFPDQWHLVNEEYPEHMVNATPVWDMGITGEGVISALVDDGLEFESEDLADNFDAAGSHDFNDHVDLPRPMLSDDHHGTRCAGQIAAVKNGVCGVGIAYSSKVAGIRILSGPITDVDEAASLNFGYQNTSIYSCSWGPPDDGRSMEAPSYIVKKAIVNGIQNGRGGKGSVFVFASGNGAYSGDQCNFDGYTNSIYSVTVAAIDYEGKRPYYSEACAANMVVTYSSGSNPKKSIVTTDIGKNKCSTVHGGTSAAAPNAAGIFALALSARPDLSWRDIQHLCVETAQVINGEDKDWQRTASGRPYSYIYGFGKLDAYDFVTAAQKWELVKPQAWVELPAIQIDNGEMDSEGNMHGGTDIESDGEESSLEVTREILEENNFEKLEHVTLRVWIKHTRRGDVEVELVSPNGIRSSLAERRVRDDDKNGFPGWKFMTVKHWGEDPVGKWTLRVWDQDNDDEDGSFLGWQMNLWGSVVDPSKAKPYMLIDTDEQPFPPSEPSHKPEPTTTSASTTKSYQKPTVVHTVTTSNGVPISITTGVVPEGDDDKAGSVPTEISHEGDFSDPRFIVAVGGFVSFLLLVVLIVFLFMRQRKKNAVEGAGYSTVPSSEEEAGGSVLAMTALQHERNAGRQHTRLSRSLADERSGDVVFDEMEESSRLLSESSLPTSKRHDASFDPQSGFLDDAEDEEESEAPRQSHSDS